MPSSAASAARPHANNFNFLRLLFASLVLVAHAPELVDGNRNRELLSVVFGNQVHSLGALAVYGFFFVSGYLILQSWIRTPRLYPYLKKRILRIVPGFIVASLVSAFVVGPLAGGADYFSQFPVKTYLASLAFLKEPAIPPVFAGQPYPFVNGSLWTIQYEFLCYLAVALVGTVGLARRRKMFLGITIALVGAVVLLRLFPVSVPSTRWTNLLPSDLDKALMLLLVFTVGGCFLLFAHRIRYTTVGAAIAGVVLLVGLMTPAITEVCLLTAGAYLLFALAFARAPALAWVNTQPDISYGVYLYGWPVQKLLHWYAPGMSPWMLLALSLPICALCGWLSWHAVEKPFLKLKKLRPHPPAPEAEPVVVAQG